MKTCESCKHWKPWTYPDGSDMLNGDCSKLVDCENFTIGLAEDVEIYTNKDFGCTEHQPKPEDGK